MRKRVLFSKFGRDISVIILGVLLALAFDNFASRRSERRLERNYIARLERDLRADSAMLAHYRKQAAAGEKGARQLLAVLKNPGHPLPDSLIARHFSDATRGAFLSPNRPTISELTSTGNLRVLRDVALRDALLTYYAEVERFQRSIETIMRRGREPLAEVGWDIRAFDLSLSYAVTRFSARVADRSLASDPEGERALATRLRAHPDALRATHRAITYQGLLHPIVTDWTDELITVQSRLRTD